MRQKGMKMELTPAEITELQQRHEVLVKQIREAAGRLGDIALALQNNQLPEGVALDEIGRPFSERP
jgi:hypothetical protein